LTISLARGEKRVQPFAYWSHILAAALPSIAATPSAGSLAQAGHHARAGVTRPVTVIAPLRGIFPQMIVDCE
jgi:hypothetical protein